MSGCPSIKNKIQYQNESLLSCNNFDNHVMLSINIDNVCHAVHGFWLSFRAVYLLWWSCHDNPFVLFIVFDHHVMSSIYILDNHVMLSISFTTMWCCSLIFGNRVMLSVDFVSHVMLSIIFCQSCHVIHRFLSIMSCYPLILQPRTIDTMRKILTASLSQQSGIKIKISGVRQQ